jgi:hypothetical protein
MVDLAGFEGPPEYYSDAASVNVNPFGVVINFGLSTESPGAHQTQATVRLSPQHAVVLGALLRNSLADYRQNVGPISLPQEIREKFGIDETGAY